MQNIPIMIMAVLWLFLFACGERKAPIEQPERVTDKILTVTEEDISTAAMLMVNGHLYYDTEKTAQQPHVYYMDGKVKNSVDATRIPAADGESNFGVGYEYRYGINDTIEVEIDGERHIFKAD